MAAPEGIACRLMRPEDWPALLALWQDVFGDPPRYASDCIESFAGQENVLVAQNGDNVAVAMLLAVPCTIGEDKGVYLYALATRPDWRGKGVMAALMEESDNLAFWRGAAFSVLIPASERLYGYYRRHGYGDTLYLRHLSVESIQEGPADIGLEKPAGERLTQLRRRWLSFPTVAFSGVRADLAARDLAGEGALLAVGDEGYALCRPEGGTLLVAELAAGSDRAAQGILASMLRQTQSERLHLTLPKASPLFARQGALKPSAVLKALGDGFRFEEETYLRFAMDEAFQFDLPDG